MTGPKLTEISSASLLKPLIALVAIVLLYFFGFNKGLALVKEAATTAASTKAKADGLEQRLNDLRTLETQFAQQPTAVTALSLAMPSEKQMAEVITMLETIAGRAGVLLESVQPGQQITAEGLPLSVTVRGGFGAVLAFTDYVEKNIRPFKIGKIDLSGGDVSTGGSDLSASFDLIAVYQVPPEDMNQQTTTPTTEETP